MENKKKSSELVQEGCCPSMDTKKLCETLQFSYRLSYQPSAEKFQQFLSRPIGIEVKFTYKYKKCPGDLVKGDLVYTNTLLPGESVRLFTSDRRSKFTYDASSAAANRNVQSSEESMHAQQFSDSMFDFSSRDKQKSSNQNSAHVDGHADAGIDILGFGGEANMSGNFSSTSSSQFAKELHQHAESSNYQSAMSTRKANSISIGESISRSHVSTSSEDQYESSSREFKNPNPGRAITFLFYQIDKTYTVEFYLEEISIRVYNNRIDNSRISANPFSRSNGIGVLSTNVLATDRAANGNLQDDVKFLSIDNSNQQIVDLLPVSIVDSIKEIVIEELSQIGLLKKDGSISEETKRQFRFETTIALPTPGVLVKGCLDDCNILEPSVVESIALENDHKRLQNDMLKKQIELLEKQIELLPQAQEYRCCPPAPVIQPE